MKNNIQYSLLSLIAIFFISTTSCKKENEKGVAKANISSVVIDEKLNLATTADILKFTNTQGQLSNAEFASWEKDQNFKSLFSVKSDSVYDLPVALLRMLNYKSEFKLGDKTIWYHADKIYTFDDKEFSSEQRELQKGNILSKGNIDSRLKISEIVSKNVPIIIENKKGNQIKSNWEGPNYEKYYYYNGTDYRMFFQAKIYENIYFRNIELKNFAQYNKRVFLGHRWTQSNVAAIKTIYNGRFTSDYGKNYSWPGYNSINSTDDLVLGWGFANEPLYNVRFMADYFDQTVPAHNNMNFHVDNAYWYLDINR